VARFNLKTRITLAISLLTAALLSLLAFSTELYFNERVKEMVFNQQYTLVSSLAGQLDDKLLANTTELVATAGTLNKEIINNPAKLREFFVRRPATLAKFDNGVFLFLPSGKLVFKEPNEPELMVINYASREYLKKTLASHTPVISEPFLSLQTHHHPIIMFTAPVFDDHGEVIAVLTGSMDLTKNNFLSKLGSVRVGERGYLYLFNKNRTFVSHPDPERLNQGLRPGQNALLDKALSGFEGSGETVNSRKVPVISAFKALKTNGWILASSIPQAEAYQPLHRVQHFLLLALLLVFLVSFSFVWFLIGRLTAPLLSITKQIFALSGKEESHGVRIRAESSDEMGMLGEAFNQLLEERESQSKELKQQLDFSKAVIDTTPIPVFYKDRDGRYLGCNRAFEDFTGFDSDFIIGKTVFDISPSDLAETYQQTNRDLLQHQGLKICESLSKHRDGTLHEVRVFLTTFPAADGTPAGIVGAMLDISDLKKAQAATEAQKEFAEGLVLNSSVPTFVLDAQHRLILWNYACEWLTGIKASELIGTERAGSVFYQDGRPVLADLIIDGTQDSAPAHYCSYTKSATIPDGVQAETWYTEPNGKRHYITMSAAPIRDSQGTLIGAIETVEDVTAQKEAQEARDKASRQLQLILDAAGEGIYGVDLQGRVTFVNPAAAAMVGWYPEELLGQHLHSLLRPSKEDGTPYPDEECTTYAAMRDGEPRQGSALFWSRNGKSFPVEFVCTPIREEGEVVGAVVVYKDVTEHKLAEEQLAKLSQAIMQSPVSVMITDPEGKIEYVNPKFTQMSGYPASEVIGQNPRLLKSGQTPDEVYRNLWETISSGKVWSGEIFNRQKDGETYWEHATISPIRNGAGVISHYMAFLESVTDRKRLEEQLRHAQKMEAVGQLAGGVAHDFNNILTAIVGFGQLLQFTFEPDDPKRAHMEQILDAADRATHLTRSLLAFSRKQVMHLQQVELNDLTRRHTKFLMRVIGEDITLKTSFSEQQLVVLADSGQVEQILMNLATNARDAMPAGGELSISTQQVRLDREFRKQHGFGTPGSYALISISDTGTGMDAKTQEKIFDPFFTTKAPGRGTGLGLSIVYGIVKQHGGYITMSSHRGLGTTFQIYLPLVDRRQEAVRKAPTLVPEGGQETILVVEDDPAVRRLVESVLKRFGYTVIAAESGEEAVALFEAKWQDINLALIDVIMPKMNGVQVCEALRQHSPRLKVLFLSGYTSDLIEDKGIRVEGIDIIMKPAKPLELAKKVREMLDAT